jgi:glycosyltransferase involved in cell wall biosynthesis
MLNKYDLSILIPARNEMFLSRTIEDILKNIRGRTEIIVVLDEKLADPEIKDDNRITIIYNSKNIGQRAATDLACKLSKAKYVMKCDAHCAFDKGFDIKMMEAFKKTGDNILMVPVMRNLHVFDWVCKKCGDRRYQGPTPKDCPKCDNKTDFEKDIIWNPKKSPQSVSYCFDSEPHFQYFKDYAKRPEYKKDLEETGLTETMSLQGSFFMLTREKYWELNISDHETFGSWGSQGIEISCKFWLSGGKVMVNHNTWYAHLFRTQGGDFGFPYSQSGRQVQISGHCKYTLFLGR